MIGPGVLMSLLELLLFDWPVKWNLTNPNSLGPELVQISEIFGLMKQYI